MNIQKIHNQGQARIFSNPFLEALSKTRPWVIYCLYLPLIILLPIYGYLRLTLGGTFIALWFLGGILFWTLFEYLAHRYLFHYHPSTEFGQRMVYIFHGNHHEFPRDPRRLFMPPLPSVLMSGTVFAICCLLSWLLTDRLHVAFIFFPGFMCGYLMYVSLHYAIHRYRPPRALRALWKHHYLHHYKDPEHAFGVSSPLWDLIFGTLPKPDSSGNARLP